MCPSGESSGSHEGDRSGPNWWNALAGRLGGLLCPGPCYRLVLSKDPPQRTGIRMPRLSSTLLVAALVTLAPSPAQAADPWFENLRTVNSTFYPKVLDDYKDYAEIKWRTADTDFEQCWASLYNSNGTLLIDENSPGSGASANLDYVCDNGSGNWLSWNGRKADGTYYGKLVPNGTYTIKVKYFDEFDDVVHVFSRKVTVATGTRWFQERYSVRGASFDVRQARGNCRVYRASGDAVLDCWDGRYAKVGYDFYLNYDLGIKDFEWRVQGARGCCAPGIVRKTGIRDRHDLDIDVRVTNWRSYRVYRVGFSWMAKNRI